MIRRKKGTIEWLEFELLAPYPLRHAIFLRHGGVSQGAFSSLNLLNTAGDEPDAVSTNRQRVKELLGLEHLFAVRQVHGNQIFWVKEPLKELHECDGLMTQQRGWGLMAMHADCQAAILYDPKQHALTTLHAGWRGQVKNIYKEAVQQMQQNFGSQPEDLLVCISPSLGPENAEFKHYRQEFPQEFWPFQIKPNYFDLWEITRHLLKNCGIKNKNVQIASLDTYANAEEFFSYRREKALGHTLKVTGGHGTVAVLN